MLAKLSRPACTMTALPSSSVRSARVKASVTAVRFPAPDWPMYRLGRSPACWPWSASAAPRCPPGREEVPRHRRIGRADAAGFTEPDGVDVEPVKARRKSGRLDGDLRARLGLGQGHRPHLRASGV